MFVRAQSGGGSERAKSGTIKNGGSFTPSASAFTSIDLGFVPTSIVLWLSYSSSHTFTLLYDVANSKVYRWYETAIGADVTSSWLPTLIKMDGTTLKYKAPGTAYELATNYIAVKE